MPAESGGHDRRVLGVPLRGVQVGRGLAASAEIWFPWVGARGTPTDWQRTYGAIVANSRFTASWVRRWWSVDSEVLYPPVSMQARGAKGPVILNVGRFFAAEQGHSKKQLEMVHAFRTLVDRGLRGWTLHLVGGCEGVGRPYLERVRAAAAGYPVDIHVDASGDDLAALYAQASIYWHASGMGESPDRHPGRLEHFGMTTVEAMSAGAVPVVIGLARAAGDRPPRRRRLPLPQPPGAGRPHRARSSTTSTCAPRCRRARRGEPGSSRSRPSELGSGTSWRRCQRRRGTTVPGSHEADHPDAVPQRGGSAPHRRSAPCRARWPGSTRSSG